MLQKMGDNQTLENELRLFFDYKRKLPQIRERLDAAQAKLDTFGVSSPKIRSTEEAKYQRGTPIYSNARLLTLIEERDRLQAEVTYKTGFCARIQAMIDSADLSPEEMELLQYRYRDMYSLRLLGQMYCSNRTTINEQLYVIREKIGCCT